MTLVERDPAMTTEIKLPDGNAAAPRKPSRKPPILEQGDRLDRAEFERRYDAMPELKKAELIEGIVSMSSPVSFSHGRPQAILLGCFLAYDAATPGVLSVDNTSVRIDDQNMLQPDAALFIESSKGGQARIGIDDYLEGAPELLAEVSSTTARTDLSSKFELYRRSGVREYLVWRVGDKVIDWFVLRDGAYDRLAADESGIYRSVVFPGLWLDSRALIAGDLSSVLAVLAQGLASEEHAAFKSSLG